MWWRRLRIANTMKTSLLYFFWDERGLIDLRLGAAEPCGPHKLAHCHQGVVAEQGLVAHWPPPEVELGADIFDIFQNYSP